MPMIINKQTAADTQSIVIGRSSLPRTIIVSGLLVAETIAVNVVDEAGAALPLYSGGSAVTLGATAAPLVLTYPITLQFVKPITANAVGVQLAD